MDILKEYPHVFVSYDNTNVDFVKEIISLLEKDKLSTFCMESDEKNYNIDMLVNEMKKSKVLIIFLSENSVNSSVALQQISLAFELDCEIVPIILENDLVIPKDIRYYLGSIQQEGKKIEVDLHKVYERIKEVLNIL